MAKYPELLKRMRAEIDSRPQMCEVFITDFTEHDTRAIESEKGKSYLWAIRPTGTGLIFLGTECEAGTPLQERWTALYWTQQYHQIFHLDVSNQPVYQWFWVHPSTQTVEPISYEHAQEIALKDDASGDC